MVLPEEALASFAQVNFAMINALWLRGRSVSWRTFSCSTQPRFARKMYGHIADVGFLEMYRDTMDIGIEVRHCGSVLDARCLEPLAPNLLIPVAPCVSLH